MLICHLAKAFRHGVPWNIKKPAAHGSKIAPTRIVFFAFFWVLEEVRFGLGINLGNIIFGESLERYSKGKNAYCVRMTFVEFPINFCFAPRYIANHANIFLIFKLALFSLIKWWMYGVETKLDYLIFHCIFRPISPRLCAVRVFVVPQKVQQRIPDLFTKNESRLFF